VNRPPARRLGSARPFPSNYAHIRDEEGVVEDLFAYLDRTIPFSTFRTIVEIGAGTGRFLEQVLKRCPNHSYEVYETDAAWSQYLQKTYNVISRPTRGLDLAKTLDRSTDLVHADYVFAYLPATTCFRYFKEICCVIKPGGYIFFDAYLDTDCTVSAIEGWLRYDDSYEVILPRASIIELFQRSNCELVDDSYVMRVYRGHTRYMIFRKTSP
jgi:ubiquinone/menaquinone biosynthesis C-methylase UbiE